jgi:hypothetical protein
MTIRSQHTLEITKIYVLTLNSSLTASTAGHSTWGLRLGEAGGGGMLALPSLLRS